MADLVRPGGALVVIGLARSCGLWDVAFDIAGAVIPRIHQQSLRKRHWEDGAPKVRPPPLTDHEMRAAAVRLLPGVQYRRHALWRYSLVRTRR